MTLQTVLFLASPVLALLASCLVIAVIRFLDVIEREPWWAIGCTFALGLTTVIPVILLSGIMQIIWQIFFGGDAAAVEFMQVVVDAPVIEEMVKAVAVVLVLVMFRRQMDSLTDFVVYACVVAIGFEFCENTLYLWMRLGGEEGGAFAWLLEFNARTMASAGMHAMFTAWSGFALWCIICQRGRMRWFVSLLGFALAIGLHASNNLGAQLPGFDPGAPLSTINYVGQSVGVVSNILQMAFFLGLITSAILQDLHLLSSFGLALQDQLTRCSDEQRTLAQERLRCFLNPFHHLVAHSLFIWRLTPLSAQSPVARPEYARFAKAALNHGATGDLEQGMALLMPVAEIDPS